ncbi:MAG: hypothetical protein J5765_05055 [Clostridia bacterium]|nr:hypothetical protein [Clostridia bacterium]
MDARKCDTDPYSLAVDPTISPKTLSYKKDNIAYVLKILINFFDHGGKVDLHAVYLAKILSGKLIHTTCPQDDEIGEKLKGLLIAFDDAENRECFMKSYFGQALGVLRHGSARQSERWSQYKPTAEAVSANIKGALSHAITYYVNDPTVPVGLDLSKCLDALIRKIGDKYVLKNLSAQEGEALIKAFERFTEMLKNTEKFKRYFVLTQN